MRFKTKRTAIVTAVVGSLAAIPLMAAAPAGAVSSGGGGGSSQWDRVAACESSGNWSANTGNGFSGGLQFTPSTWAAFGGSGNPASASKAEQIAVAQRVLAVQGPGAWPHCGGGLTAGGGGSSSQTPVAPSTPVQHHVITPPVQHQVGNTAGGTYTVVAGDTLSSIAANHGTTWQHLFELNRSTISDPDVIGIGQHLVL